MVSNGFCMDTKLSLHNVTCLDYDKNARPRMREIYAGSTELIQDQDRITKLGRGSGVVVMVRLECASADAENRYRSNRIHSKSIKHPRTWVGEWSNGGGGVVWGAVEW